MPLILLLTPWLGPLVGSLIRPVGGWLSDKLGGANVTHWGHCCDDWFCIRSCLLC